MAPRKRSAAPTADATGDPPAKRRSQRVAAVERKQQDAPQKASASSNKSSAKERQRKGAAARSKTSAKSKEEPRAASKKAAPPVRAPTSASTNAKEAVSGDSDVSSIPAVNPEAPRHDGEWYWLMKAEPESRFENGIDVKFSIDDLRAKTEPEGWDGIRSYAARNHMRNMNAGDKAFFYHSNCKEPAIVGVMEVVKEFSEDRTATQPGAPYFDPRATKGNPWSLVHVIWVRTFAVPIKLKELREMGAPGGPLEKLEMLRLSRLSVSRVSAQEFKAICDNADEKAKAAGLKHEERD